jgi:predicted RNA methylase
VLLELSSTHRAAWEKVEDLIREGEQNAFPQVFGAPLFEYISQTDAAAQAHNKIFNSAMSANTATESERVAQLCSELFSTKTVRHVVDVAGGRGVLAKAVLAATGAERATVTDIDSVVKDCKADVPNLEFKVRKIDTSS